MFISISKTGSGRYIFCVGDDPQDNSGAWLMSYRDAALLGDTPTTYASFGEAHSFASRVVEERPLCVLAKKASFYSQAQNLKNKEIPRHDRQGIAEGEIISHYIEQVELIGQRLVMLTDTDLEDFDDELGVVSKEVTEIKEEVKNLIPLADGDSRETFEAIQKRLDGFSEMITKMNIPTKIASRTSRISNHMRKAVIRAFSEAAMLALDPIHDEVFVKGASFIPSTGSYETILSTPGGDIVRLAFDRNLLLSSVDPCGVMEDCGGLHSNDFFLRYWEPIVNAVGHFYSKGNSIVAVAEMDKSHRNRMMAFSMINNSPAMLKIDRPTVMGKRTWILTKTAVEVTNPLRSSIAVNDEIECVDKQLPTYLGRTGVVTEVGENAERLVYRVDFRRGIGFIWLEENSIKKIHLGV